jgi:hypothetical protein
VLHVGRSRFFSNEVITFFNLPHPSIRTVDPGVDAAPHRNEYQESSWGEGEGES